ncbi:DUF2637 domain-containing protein [Actinoallomurus rhizosphaericola]|uniref:DUF2637 domain-containing protein n=1 Tax=Actinoallomurus rhizosphaericola TaxID=2952536 RepID=UPI00209056BA|nr:DUF2637 domain-containing protein [Actinoallomurus rhizosphaericola]MCO5993203.1 DUF2637 domain-containing protein [Actinoallomurus rhizosphaericola]
MSDSPAPYSTAQRRLLTAAGGVGVAALAGATFVLSYDDLRALALQGGADRHRAFLYPGMVDGLIVVVILSILTARRSAWWARAIRWLLLLALIVGAGAAGVERAVHGYGGLPRTWLSGGVAAAPWVILAVAVWLWLSMIKQLVRTRRRDAVPPAAPTAPSAPESPPDTTDGDRAFIPGLGDEAYAETRPLPRPAPPLALEPGHDAVRDRPHESAVTTASDEHRPEPGTAPGRETDPDLRPAGARHDGVAEADGEPETAPERTREDRIPLPRPAAPVAADPEPALPPELERQADRAWQPGPALPPGAEPAAGQDTGETSRPAERTEPDDDLVPDTDAEVMVPVPNTPVDPEQEEPPPRWVARTSLPTDVRLVGPPQTGRLGDTQPDGIRLRDTDPDGIPIPGVAGETPAGEQEDAYADDRAENPDADDDGPWSPPEGGRPAGSGSASDEEDVASTPPSSTFRSSPTPPRG